MEHLVVKNSQGLWWPKNDGQGKLEELGSCWYGLSTHGHIPESVSSYVPKKNIVVQAGGNCGYYVKKYAEIFDIVYTFEPDPLNFYCLTLNANTPNVIKFQAALGCNREGISLGNFMPDVGATHVAGKGVIPTMRVDDLALLDCDLIHLDIEGYELHALKGAEETIKKFHPVIALEFYEAWAARYNTSLDDIEGYLAQLGYEFFEDVPNAQGDRIYKFKEPVTRPKVYDCFTFFKELDVLEIRLEEMWNTTDYFIIVEATTTHSGLPKPLYLKDNWERFEKYHSKIRHIVIDDMPLNSDPWVDENYQRNGISKGLYDLQPEDIVIVSDCDEIPRSEMIEAIIEDGNDYNVYVLNVALFNYRLNFLKVVPSRSWKQQNIVVTRGRAFSTAQAARDITFKRGSFPDNFANDEMCVLNHGGWHFTYFGDTNFAIDKIKAFAHYRETDQPQYMDNISVDYMIENKCALEGPNGSEHFEYVKVDEYFPQYILNNLEKYKSMIIPNAEHTVYDFYSS